MKTSINVPDWLHDDATDCAPDVPFGELVRDALILALPLWRAHNAKHTDYKLMYDIKLRATKAESDRAVRAAMAEVKQDRDRRRRAAKVPAPGVPPNGRSQAGRKSPTKATAPRRSRVKAKP